MAGLEAYVDLVSKRVTALNSAIMARKAGNIEVELVALCLAVNTLDYLNDAFFNLENILRQSLDAMDKQLFVPDCVCMCMCACVFIHNVRRP